MPYTVKDFINMFALSNRVVEIDVEYLGGTDKFYLIYEYDGERKIYKNPNTNQDNISRFENAIVIETSYYVMKGTTCFILYVDKNDPNIKD